MTKESPVAIDFLSLGQYRHWWNQHREQVSGCSPFVTPAWLQSWYDSFSDAGELWLLGLRDQKNFFGVAPLLKVGDRVRLAGSDDLCDHLDFPVRKGMGKKFCDSLLGFLHQAGVATLETGPARPDSILLGPLVKSARSIHSGVKIKETNVAVHLPLSGGWDGYLGSLSGKQRHEVRRKLRRVNEAGRLRMTIFEEPAACIEELPLFFSLFRQSRKDKEGFMTDRRQAFFYRLTRNLAEDGTLRLFRFDLDDRPVAMTYCFDHGGTRYLYNNGFDPEYRSLSVGIVSKVMTIQEAAGRGLHMYDFLNGPELYKYRLGGDTLPLLSCTIELAG